MTDPAAPLARYTERLLQVRRELALFEDRVEIEARWLLGGTHRTTVKLSDLTPRTTELFVRNRWAKRAILVGALAVSAAVVFGRPNQEPWVQSASMVGWVVTAICAVIAGLSFRKIRFVRLLRHDGKAGLDIAQAGPDALRFEDFLTAIKRQVRRA
ncbi:MAG TPA: hypothetical protein DFS52_20940 [Myxococcales bacterium]|jgi:hypothetical protein|nr:hypothetical protein [Myxococcales bacterium]